MAIRNIFQKFGTKLFLCLFMVAAGDWLLYGQPIGWALGLYGGLVAALLLLTQKNILQSRSSKVTAFIAASLLSRLIYSPDLLTAVMYILAVITLLILSKRQRLIDAKLWSYDVGSFSSRLFTQWFLDKSRIQKLSKARGIKLNNIARYAVLPLLMATTFIYLFTRANPILASALKKVDLTFIGSPGRWIFWALTGLAVWALLRPRFKLSTEKRSIQFTQKIDLDLWLNKNAIIFSLVIFNVLFFIQNAMDVAFLWTGAALPAGMTYAKYVHAGAYPLIFTTIIAAIYVLITFGDGSAKYQSPAARVGVYLWIAQNIFLVVSAMSRTVNYIEFYSLTQLRTAGLIWMGLIAAGIFLMVLRIYLRKSNTWLLNANTLLLFTTLYICCFVNFNRMIADFNVAHAREITEGSAGTYLDLQYMWELGPEAIPALARYQSKMATPQPVLSELQANLRADLAENWRAWTWRKQQLLEEIDSSDAVPIAEAIPPSVDPSR
ncbi:MAG TPA: DUF4173 domain-containing protein [Alphaproteobacteria bacterium]|nr:DUF4173 domain-containing protein [Alphaproteobacteria bacterium]